MSGFVLNGISKSFGDTRSVGLGNLSFDEGGLTALLGTSGCGMIAGLKAPLGGAILLGQGNITDLPGHKRRFCMVFQSFALFPHPSVRDGAANSLHISGVSKAEATERANKPQDLVQLSAVLFLQQSGFSFWYAVIASVPAALTALPFTLLLTRLSHGAQAAWLVFIHLSLSPSEGFIFMGWDILLPNNSGLPALFKSSGLTQWLKDTGWFQVLGDWGLANPRDATFKTSQFATILTMGYLVWLYAVIMLYPALSRLDHSWAKVARTMGAWCVARTVILPTKRLPLFGTMLLLFAFQSGAYVAVTVLAAPAQHSTAVAIYTNIRAAGLNASFGVTQAVTLLISAGVCLALGHRINTWAEAL